ncbi:hypothetical protein CDL15_Pgr010896 [Punica granatum]|uniref:C2H2-type domain-containing protein n=1 Tax=Punica granatum TaxID=22663 RepID=A0A218XP69_PUNGR|nr:hypothetical protein CDL15_Pgr010896 [Punica granatum]
MDFRRLAWTDITFEEVEEEEIEEMEDDGAVYPCPYCSEDFDDAELVEYHIREAHPSKSDYDSEVPPANEVETVQSNLSTSVVSSLEKFPNEEGVERSVHPSPTLEEKAADKEARSRCEFAQALTLSSFFDMDF